MSAEHPSARRTVPGWLVAVMVFTSGIVIGRTLAQLAEKSGLL